MWSRLVWRLRNLARKGSFATGISVAALLLSVVLGIGLGSTSVGAGDIVRALSDAEHPARTLLVRVRIPRVVGALLTGAALAVAGGLMQTAVRNPLADAGLLGVTAGGGLAGILWLTFVPHLANWLVAVAFAGALGAVGVLLSIAATAGPRMTPLILVLSGVALQAVLFAGVSLVSFLFADRAPAFVAFTVGTLAGTGWREITSVVPAVAIGLTAAFALAPALDLLLFDDGTASGLGLRVARVRLLGSAVAALLAAAAVAVAGLVGFIGLLVPNAIRQWTGPRHGRLLPLSALLGATAMVLADLLARTLAAPVELPVGALLALVGGPYFLFLLLRRVAR